MCKTVGIKEFVEISGITRKTLLRLIRQGEAPGKKVGREYRILKQDIEPFLKEYFKKPSD